MKLLVSFATLFLCVNSIAQTADENSFNPITQHAGIQSNEAKISEVTLKSFNRQYKNASNIVWSTLNEGNCVKFSLDEIEYRVFYNKKGRWMSTIKNLPNERLPWHVANRIKQEYPGFNVFFAQHVHTSMGQAYVIKIEKGESWKQVKLVGSEVEVMGDYIRS